MKQEREIIPMSPEKKKQELHTPKEIFEKQFAFALFQIQNLQELVGRADSKAQFILGANAVLFSATVALFPEVRSMLSEKGSAVMLTFTGLLIMFVITGLVSMTQAFWVVYPTSSRVPSKIPKSAAGHLVYFREIIHSYDGSTEYNQSLIEASPQDILAQVSQQIYSLSRVSSKKYDVLRASTKCLIICLMAWVFILIGTLVF